MFLWCNGREGWGAKKVNNKVTLASPRRSKYPVYSAQFLRDGQRTGGCKETNQLANGELGISVARFQGW